MSEAATQGQTAATETAAADPSLASQGAPATGDQGTGAAAGAAAAGTAPATAPVPPAEASGYQFQAPEGAAVDETQLGAYRDAAHKAGLTQDQFNAMAAFGADAIKQAAGAPHQAWADLQQQWTNEIKADPAIGGAKLPESLAAARVAIDQLGGDALRTALDTTGAGNNPAIVKAFVEMGKRLQDASQHVTGSPAGRQLVDRSFEGMAAHLWPNMAGT